MQAAISSRLALAAANYMDTVGCLPQGTMIQRIVGHPELGHPENASFGHFVALLPYLEQQPLFDATNFLVNGYEPSNSSVHATGLAVLWCPSDPTVSQSVTITNPDAVWTLPVQSSALTSYAGSCGPWQTGRLLRCPPGFWPTIGGCSISRVRSLRPWSAMAIARRLSSRERAHGLLSPDDAPWWNWWASSFWDTDFVTWFGINPHRRFSGDRAAARAAIQSASSFHPGGANFAMLDSSVRFLKDSIDTWQVDPMTGAVAGVSREPVNFTVVLAPGTRIGALSGSLDPRQRRGDRCDRVLR